MLIREFAEELIAVDLLLVLVNLFSAMRQNHVVKTLVGSPGNLGPFAHDVDVFVEGAFPVFLAIFGQVEIFTQGVENRFTGGHILISYLQNSWSILASSESF